MRETNLLNTVLLIFFLFTYTITAQQNLAFPDVSQHAVTIQQVGPTEIKIDYHRPGVKARQIWGGIVPYGQVWRAGANENTTISFSKEVIIDGKTVPSGTYGLHMIPTENEWTIILSKDYKAWGSFFYNEANDLMRFKVQPSSTNFQEWLLYSFDEVTPNSTIASLKWEKLMIPFKIEINLHKQVLDDITVQLTGIPGFFWQGWNQAAVYCYTNNIELERGLEWVDHSISINKNFTNSYTKALLLSSLGRGKEASDMQKEAYTNAQENDINVFGYQLMNNGKIDEAIDVFKKNTELYPKSWNVWDSLGEGYMNKGEKKLALESYNKALSMAPENQVERIKNIISQLENN